MPKRLLIKLIAGLTTCWLALIWSDNIPNPSWLKEDTESLMTIPAIVFWLIGFWEDIENHIRSKLNLQAAGPLPANPAPVENLPVVQVQPVISEETSPSSFDSSSREVRDSEDPILDPWLERPLLGRDTEIDAVAKLLATSNGEVQVTHTQVLAAGGVGKTEVCKAALRKYMRLHPFKKVWFINLEQATWIGDLWSRIANAIQLEDLRDEQSLINAMPEGIYYLDNLESLAGDPVLPKSLRALSHNPGVRLLASSRTEIPGWGKTFDLNVLSTASAVDLFLQIWTESGGQMIASDDAALISFVENELGNLPLAVVLVAALGRYDFTLSAVRSRWEKEGVAAVRRPGMMELTKAESLDISIKLSLNLLSEKAKNLWGAASFFPAGLPVDLMDELTAYRDARDQLIQHRILHRQANGRLRLSPPLARFARDQALANTSGFAPDTLFGLVAPWLQQLGERAHVDQTGKYIQQLLEEFPAIETIALFFCSLDTIPTGFMFLIGSWQNFYNRKIFTAVNIFRAILQHSDKLKDNDRAWLIEQSGELEILLGNNELAREHFSKCLILYEKLGDDLGNASTIRRLGDLEFRLGNNELARGHFSKCLPMYEKVGSDLGKANTLHGLGELEFLLGNDEVARDYFSRCLPLYEKIGNDLGKANTHKSLGELEFRLGNNEVARQHFSDCLPLYQKQGADLGKANIIRRLGDLEFRLGNDEVARQHFTDCLLLYEIAGNDLGKANTLRSLGNLELASGNDEVVSHYYIDALRLYERIADPVGLGWCHLNLGNMALRSGDKKKAEKHYQSARFFAEKLQNPSLIKYVNDMESSLNQAG